MPRRWQVLTVVSIAVFMASLDLFIVNIAFWDIQRDFSGAGVASVSWCCARAATSPRCGRTCSAPRCSPPPSAWSRRPSGAGPTPGPWARSRRPPSASWSLAGALANRLGQRALAAAGISLFALGCVWWLWQLGPERDYAGQMLPGLIVTGIGVGLTLPSLASAAAASLPPARFATGAVFTMSRQLGFVLGVAVLVAVLGSADAADPAAAFDGGWLFMVIAAVLGAGAAVGIGEVRQHVPALAAPSVAVAADG